MLQSNTAPDLISEGAAEPGLLFDQDAFGHSIRAELKRIREMSSELLSLAGGKAAVVRKDCDRLAMKVAQESRLDEARRSSLMKEIQKMTVSTSNEFALKI